MTTPSQLGTLLKASRDQPNGLVPVIGSGANIEASKIEHRGPADDWAGLLDSIAAGIGLTTRERAALPASFLARWEHFVLRWAHAHDIEPYKAEAQLQTQIVAGLRSLEDDAAAYTLYREFANAGLSDLMSLNFDRRIAVSSGREKFDAGPKNPPEGPSARTLYRHSRVAAAGDQVTRIWYPHGDTRRADTLKLGVRRYGFHLGILREYLGFAGDEWRTNLSWEERQSASWNEPSPTSSGEDEAQVSWVDLFLSRPLLFVGCGLGADEWSLWWLLRIRARTFEPPPAYFAYVGDCDVAITVLGRAQGLLPIEFRSYEHLWNTIRKALS